jgi:3-deoxy-D-manno-octulosonic acid kinase
MSLTSLNSSTTVRTAEGAIIYDGDIFAEISDVDFKMEHWPESRVVTGGLRSSGRGNTTVVRGDEGQFVLRHFVRGGLVSRFITDSYFWCGEEATRAFSEWRLLCRLVAMELPVPRPAAARYIRSGLTYKADLLTVLIPDVIPLSDRIATLPCGKEFWQKLGREIAPFHKAGVCHADLNAYNVQIDKDDKVWLLDFDRGSLRQPGTWQQKNLVRLHRSLQKVMGLDPRLYYSESSWQQFLDGYFSASRFA